jgi:signal transduction histidine kinase
LIVAGDQERLQQIAWNLLSNAVKFTGQNGRVEVKIKRDGAFGVLEVADNGEGIEPSFLPFVFDRFRQADGSTTRQHGGLGLELSIVRHLVELHGGTAEAESAGAGQGATFRVRLPLEINEQA